MIDYEQSVLGILEATGPLPTKIILCTLQSSMRKPNLNAEWSITQALNRLIDKGLVRRKGAFYEKIGGDAEPCDISSLRMTKAYCAIRDGISSRADLSETIGVDRVHIGELLRIMAKKGFVRNTDAGWVLADD